MTTHSTPAETPEFPTPADRPDADVVLYDGECNFCRAQVMRIQRWDGGGRLAYLSIHDPLVTEHYPGLPQERLLREMCVVERSPAKAAPETEVRGSQRVEHWGADAVRYLSRRLPGLWWLSPLLHLPGAMLVARPAYRLVARNRYLLGGKRIECESDACSLHR